MQLYGPSFDGMDLSGDETALLTELRDLMKDFHIRLDRIAEDNQAMRNELVQATASVQEMRNEINDFKKIIQNIGQHGNEVEHYNQTTDWGVLRASLEKALGKNRVERCQLQSINDHSWGHLWQVGHGGHAELATLLLNAGLPVNKTDYHGDSMLHGAAEGGRVDLAQLLVERGADVNSRGWRGLTPFNKAALGGKPEMVQWLVDRGADVHAADDCGMTGLHFAAEHGHLEVVWRLVHLGLSTSTRDNKSWTPFHWARQQEHAAVMRYLSDFPH
ncbi:26S proteasome non-ATPase regulatory subunit 10-like isoform X2 [Bacillus rossius redtenbacheri]|uniref:26S proteasome non-ATPase regulatory subunit 10-like isoform X2 n=1 Tax=Bacillus rossius redtenbacheri TaxID=93214 RepID=UPI002FDC91CD